MESEIISKEELEKIKSFNGDAKGAALIEDFIFIRKEDGKEALKKIQDYMKGLGISLDFRRIKPKENYPLWINTVVLLAMKRLLNYNYEKFQKLGGFNARHNIFTRIFMRYFASMDMAAEKAQEIWNSYYTVGKLEIPEYSRDKKYAILRLEDFPYPGHCENFEGYFCNVVEMIIGKPGKCEETKCTLKGDPYHEFKVTW